MGNLTVTIVVDPEFGDRLSGPAEHGPVWIAQTPVNRAAAVRWWNAHSPPGENQGVTTFLVEPGGSPERWFLEVLGTVDMHYGGYGPDEREYTAVEVWGAAPTAQIRAALTELGYGVIVPRAGGFRAGRSSRAA